MQGDAIEATLDSLWVDTKSSYMSNTYYTSNIPTTENVSIHRTKDNLNSQQSRTMRLEIHGNINPKASDLKCMQRLRQFTTRTTIQNGDMSWRSHLLNFNY